jgi:hypothetical protein
MTQRRNDARKSLTEFRLSGMTPFMDTKQNRIIIAVANQKGGTAKPRPT